MMKTRYCLSFLALGLLLFAAGTSIAASAVAVTLAASSNPSVYGQPVTFTASVTPGATGTVSFYDNGVVLSGGDSITLDGPGQATVTTAGLTTGTHSITAVYSGDSTYTGSTSNVVTQIVNPAASSTLLASSQNPSFYLQAVTFTATVPADVTGFVTFKDGDTTLGTAMISGGTATFTTSALTAGSHSITAVYGGDSNFEGSTSPVLAQTVGKKTPSVRMASSPRPSVYGQPVTMTVTLPADATGTVTFKEGSTVLGTSTVSGGTASLTASIVQSRYYYSTLVGYYSGDTNYIAYRSDPRYQHIVYAADTTTTLISSSNPSIHGSPITITAVVEAVAPGGGIPGGSVEMFDGTTSLGTGALDGSGRATFAANDLAIGSHSLTAVYSGTTYYHNGSTSTPLTQTVKEPTSVLVTTSSNPSLHWEPVTLTATVTGSDSLPAGTVEFLAGSVSLGMCALDGSGQGTLITSDISAGSHSITAIYSGDATHDGSTSAAVAHEVSLQPPVAAFAANVTAGTAPLAVQFTDLSTASPVAWQWSFGDGMPNLTVQNPVHTFGSPGLYTVMLTAINADGSGSVQKAGLISVTAPTPLPVPATYNMSDFYGAVTQTPLQQPTATPTFPSVVTPAAGPKPAETTTTVTPTADPAAEDPAPSGFPWWIVVVGTAMLGLAGAAYYLVPRK